MFCSETDEQLRRSWELKAFHFIFDIHVVMLGVFTVVVGLELLHVRGRGLHVQWGANTVGESCDCIKHRDITFHIFHVDERHIWSDDGNRNN